MTTPSRPIAIAIVAVLSTVTIATVAASCVPHQRHRDIGPSPTAPTRTALVVETATAFVTALDDVDRTQPHGDPHALRRLADPHLLAQLTTSTSLTYAQLHANVTQHATVTSVAVRMAGDGAVALVTAQLTVTGDGTPPVRAATSYTLTLRRANARWLVVAATA